jgi:hypothetical protein
MRTYSEWRRNNRTKTITVTCQDDDNSLEDLLHFIKKSGNSGHTFEIVADGKSFEWDGDGNDAIFEIKVDRGTLKG